MKSKHTIRNYLFTGLLVWIPIGVTFFALRFVIDLLDGTMRLLPKAYQAQQLIGVHIPGLGVILSFVILFLTGLVATNYFGKKLVGFGESILARIPLVRTIYKAVKQVMETILSSSNDSFRKVLLVQYPREGLWSIAFLTSSGASHMRSDSGEELMSIFIPTTPNPTSGFLIMVPKSDTRELDMSVDEALKMVISLGVMQPNGNKSA